MTRRRVMAAALAGSAVLVASGCMGLGGGDDAADATPPAATAPATVAAPVAVAPATLGGPVRAGANTPKDVVAALKGDKVLVVAFLNRKAADDQRVAAALRAAQADKVASANARFFVYTVGKTPFGDLADLLGVEGTPAVAVIGRDRNLSNLFTGLVDGDILRQAIWDAGDTPAANRGTAAKATPAASALGDPAGIALARKVRAAYRDVPGVAVSGSLTENEAAFTFDAEMALSKGDIVSFTGTLKFGDTGFEMVRDAETFHMRSTGAACWAAIPVGAAVPDELSNPAIPLAGTRFSAPRRDGGRILLDATQGAVTATYVIDSATHRVTEVRAGGVGTVTFRALDKAPAATTASPICDDPSKAIDAEALAAFGGTVS